MSDNKLTYGELIDEIETHKILFNLFDWELECSKGNEFDFEFMEFRTDDILRLIQNQGGNYE